MIRYSTRQVAEKLGITHATLSRYLSAGKLPAPETATGGGMTVHLWSPEEIEQVRKLLPKIANGRKTRWQRQRAMEKQAKATAEGGGATRATLHKQGSHTKKKNKKK
jgi:predicted DNA-binding transcriptional regulator AlpA